MSIFGKIIGAIFGSKADAAPGGAGAPAAGGVRGVQARLGTIVAMHIASRTGPTFSGVPE